MGYIHIDSALIAEDLEEDLKDRFARVAETLLAMGSQPEIWDTKILKKVAKRKVAIAYLFQTGLQLTLRKHRQVTFRISQGIDGLGFVSTYGRISFERDIFDDATQEGHYDEMTQMAQMLIMHRAGIVYLEKEYQNIMDLVEERFRKGTLNDPEKMRRRQEHEESLSYLDNVITKPSLRKALDMLCHKELWMKSRVTRSECEGLSPTEKRHVTQLEKLGVISVQRHDSMRWDSHASGKLIAYYEALEVEEKKTKKKRRRG